MKSPNIQQTAELFMERKINMKLTQVKKITIFVKGLEDI